MSIAGTYIDYIAMLFEVILNSNQADKGPIIIVSNEIGLGVIPMGQEVRAFVDVLGKLNQDVAERCDKVTLMVAGLPLNLKSPK